MKKAGNLILVFGVLMGLLLGATLVQAADAPNMTGTWNLSVVSAAGPGSPTFVLTQEGEKITGTYKGAFGDSEVTGKITGNEFVLKFKSAGNDISYQGKIEGNNISGTLDMGSYGTGTFKGKRE